MQEEKTNFNQVGGHDGCIVADGNKLTKATKKEEAMVYRAINGVSLDGDLKLTDQQRSQLEKIKEFTPTYYSSAKETITIENMLHCHDGASFMDIKMGTSTVTMKAKGKGEEAMKIRKGQDDERGSTEFGWTITGYVCEGIKYDRKEYIITDRREHLNKLFLNNGKFEDAAADVVVTYQEKLLVYFNECNTYEVRGASVFLVMDFKNQQYGVKLIDLNSFEDIGKKDEGFVKGLETLKEDIQALRK